MTTVTKKTEFKPVRLSVSQLGAFIEAARKWTVADTDLDNREPEESLYATAGDLSVSADIVVVPDTLESLPDGSTSLQYNLRIRGENGFSIQLSCADWSRTLQVSGDSISDVDFVLSALSGKIQSGTQLFTGPLFRFAIGVSIWLVGVLLQAMAIAFDLGIVLDIVFPFLGLAMIALSMLLPWKKMLPGFLLYQKYVKFGNKFASEISIIGLLVGLVGLALAIMSLVY